MIVLVADGQLWRAAYEQLQGNDEQVGFFLAHFDDRGAFVLKQWRSMPPDAFQIQSAYHVTLRDDVRPELIGWAARAGACLVEIHSHTDAQEPATFSSSDLYGLEEWVPHVRWRLKGRPYAAIVTAGETFDALAWVDEEPSQVDQIEVDEDTLVATGLTLGRLLRNSRNQ